MISGMTRGNCILHNSLSYDDYPVATLCYQDFNRIQKRDIRISKQGFGGPRGSGEPSLLVISSLYQDLIKFDR
jgi:hypothetical protein